jgi:septal ring factor EnvC (AmiA/AmiB activator)
MSNNRRTFYHNEDGSKEREKKHKQKIKELEKEIKRLKSELKTYERAFKKTEDFLKESTDEFSVEACIDAAKKDKSLKQLKEEKPENTCYCKDRIKLKVPFGTISFCKKCNRKTIEKDE